MKKAIKIKNYFVGKENGITNFNHVRNALQFKKTLNENDFKFHAVFRCLLEYGKKKKAKVNQCKRRNSLNLFN